ncbi:MAG: ATP-binding protein [Candidatus Aenigmarchaeota archaeon]|nr:ATP-binding protein [Candidatus Aenigmarchaeota archaeon]
MLHQTVVGRLKEEYEKIGIEGSAYIGKHIVGKGEDAHLTTKVYLDLIKPHVILICGKRGTGKSYAAATIVEGFCLLEEELRRKSAFVIFDPIGIYWSLKLPNEKEEKLLKEWSLEPKGFGNVKIFVPKEFLESYKKAGIPVDFGLEISFSEFDAEDWLLAFEVEPTSEIGIALQKNLSELKSKKERFGIEDLLEKIKKDEQLSLTTKNALLNYFELVKSWGIFTKEGMRVEDIVEEGQVSILDFSRVKGAEWGLRNLTAAWLTRSVYKNRVLARKEEELAKIEEKKPKYTFPLTWLVFEEAHNFCPSDKKTVSLEPILNIAKQGREPGVSLIVITQMPNKVHQEILSQTDIVISFRLTSKQDIEALHTVMQTYMQKDIMKFLNDLPKWPGASIILDDNLEKVFTVQIRPRISHHAGGTASLI